MLILHSPEWTGCGISPTQAHSFQAAPERNIQTATECHIQAAICKSYSFWEMETQEISTQFKVNFLSQVSMRDDFIFDDFNRTCIYIDFLYVTDWKVLYTKFELHTCALWLSMYSALWSENLS